MKKTSLFLLSIFLLAISFLTLNAQGTLWGEATGGGATGGGTIFKTNYDGTGFTKVKDLVLDVPGGNPISRLAIGPSPNLNGMLFGCATNGGDFDNGLIFKYDPAANSYTKVYDFNTGTDGVNPAGSLLLYGTKFYGVTSGGGSDGAGTIFEFDPATNSVTKKVDFQSISTGAYSSGYLTQFNNKLYGTTSEGGANNAGTLFEFDPAGTVGTNIINKYDFNNTDGRFPFGELTVFGSLIYGTASAGGANDAGVIFEFYPAAAVGSNYVKKVDFDETTLGSNPSTGLTLVSGTMYGTTTDGGNSVGTIYAYVPGSTSASVKEYIIGNYPFYGSGNLLYANGLLYGSTRESMFSYDPTQPAGTGFAKVIDYDYYSTGTTVLGGFMLAPSGKIYGLALSGGLAQAGAIIEYDPASSISSTNPRGRIYFGTSSGSIEPFGGFVFLNGKLYGKTAIGGLNGGTIFEIDPANGNFVETTFKSSSQGTLPSQPVVAGNGKLYGITGHGGIVYEYDPNAHTITDKLTLDFTGLNFTIAPNGLFYGITPYGGGGGTVYEYDPVGNTVTKKVVLASTYNHYTLGYFLLAPNGKLYSLCQGAGANGKGFLLEYEPGATTVSKKYDFTTGIGGGYLSSNQLAVNTANGKLYGVRGKGGANSQGSIIEYTLPSVTSPDGVLVEKYSFQLPQDLFPASGLVESGNGKFYGLLSGDPNFGNLYEYDPVQNTFAYKVNFTSTDGIGPAGLSIIPDPQTITFGILPSKLYGEKFKLVATASSSLPVTYTSSNTNVAIVNGDSIIVKGVGTTTITAYQTGNGGYLAATPVQQTLTTIKAAQTITFLPLNNKKLNDSPFTLSASASSTLPVTYVTSNPLVASISGNTVMILGHGSTDIQASQAGNSNYSAATPVTQTLTIVNTTPTVANLIAEQEALQLTPFSFTFANNTFADADGDALTYTATRYDGSNLQTWLTFNAATRTFSGTPGVKDTTATINLTANDGFNGMVTTPFKIRIKATQTITFSPLSNKKLHDSPFTLSATASSTLPVTYTTSNPLVASISGSTVMILGHGSTDIQASQAGNDNYGAATPVTQTLTIVNTTPTVANVIAEQEALQLTPFSFTFASNTFADADDDALTYTATRYDGSNLQTWVTFNAATRTFSGTPGVKDTTATINLTANDGFNGMVTTPFKIRIKIITGIEPENTLIKIYPNPVHHTLTVENESGEVLPIIVRSSLGEVIYQNEQGRRYDVNTLPWAAGLYIVEVRRGAVITQTKIIKY